MLEEDFKIEYKYLLDYLNECFVIAKRLQVILDSILYGKSQLTNFRAYELRYIENNLFYIDTITNRLKEILEDSQNISIDNIVISSMQDKKIENNVVIFPAEQDEDIYVYPWENIADIWDKY